MPLELLVIVLDDVTLVDTELLTATEEEPVNEGLLEPDTDVLNDNDPVADKESRDDIEELDEIEFDSLEEDEIDN